MCHYTGGARVPQVVMVRRICQTLRVSADFLLGLTNVWWDLPAHAPLTPKEYRELYLNEAPK